MAATGPAAKTQAALALECIVPPLPELHGSLSPGDCLRRLFVAALTEQNNEAWKNVFDYLSNLSPFERQKLSREPDVLHYVCRTVHYADNVEFPDSHVDILQCLSEFLPGVVEDCRKERLSTTYTYNLPLGRSVTGARRRHIRKRVVSLDSGLAKLLTYSYKEIPATFRGPSVQLCELGQAALAVSQEMKLQSKTISPLSSARPLPTTITPPSHPDKPALSPVYHWQLDGDKELSTGVNSPVDSGTHRKVHFEEMSKVQREKSSETKLHTAYDVIAAFANGSLQAGAESVYLNPCSSSPWSPYNLCVVSKMKANPEHCLISKFGILHVHPDGSSDLQSFADWLREAGLFSLCQQIPYFRQFLLRKMFHCWHRNVCYHQFVRLYSEVNRVGLRFFPNFHEAVDKIHKLNTELLSIPTHTLTPFGQYSPDTLEKTTEEAEAKTHRLLQRYFKYCKRIVLEAINATRMETERLEEEKKHQPFVSDSPISVQVQQHAELEHKLKVAWYRSSRLPDFVCLAEQMMSTCLLQMARQSGKGWVQDTLCLNVIDIDDRGSQISEEGSDCTEYEDDNLRALLTVELKISEKGGVVTEPSGEKIASLLTSPLHDITSIVSSCSSPLTPPPTTPHPPHSHLSASAPGEGDNMKTLLAAGWAKTRNKPLMQALKGISSESGAGSVLESSRARSRLEGTRPQGTEVMARDEEFSSLNSPLIAQNMENKLHQDTVLKTLCSRLEAVVNGLQSEVSNICHLYSWLDGAHSLIIRCKKEKTSDMTAHNFESLLGELHSALYRISHLPPHIPTSHSLITISTVGVASHLEPQLHQAVSRLQKSLASQALDTATQLLKDAVQYTQMLSAKRYDLEGFVQYSRSLQESQAFYTREADNTQRVSDIHTTLKRYSIQTSELDIQRLKEVWKGFEASLEDGEKFVKTQTPIKAQGLQESISILDEQLEQLLQSASVGDFVNPSFSPYLILPRLESIHQEMTGIRSRLLELSKWEEAITGRHHNLSRMFHCFDVMYARQELWKYRRQFDSVHYDWSIVPFKKLDIEYLEQKVSEWWKVCENLGKILPPEDPVLEQWQEKVEKLHSSMSIIQLLASRNLQTSHWYTIFAAFNEQYDSQTKYTLQFFLRRDLRQFDDIIHEVYLLASQQSRLRDKFSQMERQWESKAIDLYSVSVERYSFCRPRKDSKRTMTITFFDPTEATTRPGTRGQEMSRDQLYRVEGGENLMQEVESATLELNVMLSSPHLGGLKGKVQMLRSSLQQASELFSSLLLCLDQWWDLLELFLYIKHTARKSSGVKDLQAASSHLKEVMDGIRRDPRLFSLLNKSRGQKGARDLQGPELKRKLNTVLECMNEVVAKLGPKVTEAVSHCPRLGYLSQRQILKVLSCRGDPLPIIPLITRMFPSIKTLRFVETSSNTDRDSSKGYQVIGVEGELREHLSLVLPLPLEQKPAVEWLAGLEKKPAVEWLAGLEQAVRFSLASRLTDCLARLPRPLTGQPLTTEEAVLEWLSGHVQQSILLALDIHWSSRLLQACSEHTHSSLQTLHSQLQRAMENTVQLLLRHTTHQSVEGGEEDGDKKALTFRVLQSVIIYLRRKSDFAHSLLTSSGDVDKFWQQHLHYTTTLSTDNEARPSSRILGGSKFSPGESKASLTASRTSLTASRTSLTASRSNLPSSKITQSAGLPGPSLGTAKLHPYLSSPALRSPSSPAGSSAAASRTSIHSSSGDHLQISSPSPCTVHAGGSSVGYGFEYYGPAPQVVMTPAMESGVIAIVTAIAQYQFPGVTGEKESQRTETVNEVVKLLGRHHFTYTCSPLTTSVSLLHLVHTALSCGSLLILEGLQSLPTTAQLTVRHNLQALQSALATCFLHTTSHPHSGQMKSEPSCDGTPFNSCPSRIMASRLDWYGSCPLPISPSLHSSQSLDYMGHTVTASPLFTCCLILSPDQPTKFCGNEIRGVVCMKPEKRLIAEVLMSSYGFSTAYQLSQTLITLSDHLQSQLGVCTKGVQFNITWLHKVVSLAALLRQDSTHHSEETLELNVVSRAVLEVTTPLIPGDQVTRLQEMVAHHLPSSGSRVSVMEEKEEELVQAIRDEMRERHLTIQAEVTEKILQLHHSLDQYHCTVMLGPKSSGITSSYRTLSSAYQRLGKPPIDVVVINPAVYSWEQLFGGYSDGQWTNGILTRLLLQLSATEGQIEVENHPDRVGSQQHSETSHWIVLDGPITPLLLDTIATLLTDGGLCFPGMERVTLPSSCRLLLKPGALPSLSPGLLGSCGLLHWSCDTLTHEMLLDSWLDRAPTQHDLSAMSIQFIGRVLQTLIPESLSFLDTVCSRHYSHLYTAQARQRTPGSAETLSLLSLLSAMLERNCPTLEGTTIYSSYQSRASSVRSSVGGSVPSSRCGSAVSRSGSAVSLHDDATLSITITEDRGSSGMDFMLPASLGSVEAQVLGILCFAFIWSIGGYVPFSEMTTFSEFAMEQINDMPISVGFPDEGCVFDYYLDFQTYRFEPWSKRKGRLSVRHSGYVPTPELTCVAYIAEVYLSYGYNIVLLGESGSGKTSFTEFLLQTNMSLTRFPIGRSMTVPQLQTALTDKVTEMTRRDQMRWGARKIGMRGQTCLFFLDDLHLGCHRQPCTSTSPPTSIVELVSFASRHSCLFGYPDTTLCYMDNVQYIVSCLPGNQFTLLPQLLGSFHPVPLLPPSDKTLHTIFSSRLLVWFKKYPNAAVGQPDILAKALSVASLVTFRSVSGHLQPSTTHPHWYLSLQHLMNVYEGLVLMPLDSNIKTQQFGLLNRRAVHTSTSQSNYGRKTASRRCPPKTGRRASVFSTKGRSALIPKPAKPVRLPPMRKESESGLRDKIKSELKGMKKQQQHDTSDIQATLHQLVRLWCHENTRVYADRMTESKDRLWFLRLLETCVKYCFCGIEFDQSSPLTSNTTTASTAARGGVRRGRGVRGRVTGGAPSEGLKLTELLSSGVRADILQTLLPREGQAEAEGEGGCGRLIPFDQVIMRGEDVTGLIFCKLPPERVSSARSESDSTDMDGASSSEEESGTDEKGKETTSDPPTESVYQELGDGQVMETMEKHISHYTAHCRQQTQDSLYPAPDLILFQGAMEHAARLCRVMIIPGCHAILLGVNGSGRKSLCRFVSYMMRAQLFEIGGSEGFKETLKEASMSAATNHLWPTVLLISCAGQCRDLQPWSRLSQVMSEGTCSDLFTNMDMIRMQNVLRRGLSKRTISPQAIAKLIKRNLHVVIAWDISRTTGSPINTNCDIPVSHNGTGGQLEEMTRDVYSVLCSQCSIVDYYPRWSGRDLGEVAQRWWKEKTCSLQQGWITSESQLECLANLAAHVHLSSLVVLDETCPHLSSLLTSPVSFTQCLTLAHSLAITLQEKCKGGEERLCKALEKLAAAEQGERGMEAELAALQPDLRAIEKKLDERNKIIEACQQRYKEASQKCQKAKKTIDTNTLTVEELRTTVAEKMEQVSSLLRSAMEDLSSVKKNDVLEVMSYREPPAAAVPVFDTLCMLFDRPQTWEECKQLLLSPNFFESLKFFDKDSVPRHKLRQLKAMLKSRAWRVDSLRHASRAVSSLAVWVAALLDYHHARDVVKPFKERLATAEKVLTEAEVMFVAMQRDMLETKAEFKGAQKERNNCQRQKTSVESKIAAVQQRQRDASLLLSALSPWKARWEKERADFHTQILSIPGHAVLTAASITYLSRVPADRHRPLWDGWLGYCAGRVQQGSLVEADSQHSYHSHQPNVEVEPGFSIKSVLSVADEQSHWNQYASFPDSVSLERCIAARTALEKQFCPLPLIFDPNQLFQHYAHELEFHRTEEQAANDTSTAQAHQSGPTNQPASCVTVLRVSDGGWAQSLCEREEARDKAVVLLLDEVPSPSDRETLKTLLRERSEDLKTSWDQSTPSANLFRLYLVLEEGIKDSPSSVLQSLGLCLLDFSVVDMELSLKALECHLLKVTLRLEHPEYAVRHRALLVDRALYEQQIEDSKEQVIVSVLDSVDLLDCAYIADIVRESQQNEITALDYIQDTNKALGKSRGLVDSYRLLSHSSALYFITAHRLCRRLKYRDFSLQCFQELVSALLVRHKHIRPPDNPAACNGHVLHLKKQLLLELHHHLRLRMFSGHHILLPLLVHTAQLLAAGRISREEYTYLREDSGLLEHQLDLVQASGTEKESHLRRPTWLSEENWCAVHLLEKVPGFQGLSLSVTTYSGGWQEYCGMEVSFFLPTPLHPSHPSLYHALLLWKALNPDKFPEAVEEFVSLSLGPEFTSWGRNLTYQNRIDHILSCVPPCTPVACLIQSEGDEDTVARILKAVAEERSVPYHYLELGDMCDRDNALLKLAAFCSEGGWAVIGYSYLQSTPEETWQQLTKTLRDCESQSAELQLWVTVPLLQSTNIAHSWPLVVLEDQSTAHLTSRELLADVRQAVNCDTGPPTLDVAPSLLVSLQHLLPAPLSDEEMKDLSPTTQHGTEHLQTSVSFLYHELQQTNTTLLSLHAVLQWSMEWSSHPSRVSSQAAQATREAAENKIPQLWRNVLPPHLSSLPSLLLVVQLLRESMDYLTGTVRSGWDLAVKLHPLWVSNPRDLISRVQHWFSEVQQTPLSEVTLMTHISKTKPDPSTCSQTPSITFHSLMLCGATWDQASSTLTPTSPSSPPCPVYVTLTPTSRQMDAPLTCQCPVYSTADQHTTLLHLPLPTSSPSTHASLYCHTNHS